MFKIKVSVIVPVFNVEKYLEQCLNSLVNQTLKDIEIICINDGSTDNSYEILKKFKKKDKRIKIFSFKENKGQGVCRNKGIELSTGEYISFVDSDDWVELDFLEKTYHNAISNNSDIVLCNAIEEYSNYQKERIYFQNNEINSNMTTFNYKFKKNRLLNYFLTIWAKLHKTQFLKDNSIKFPDIIFEDAVFHVESFLKAEKISYCNNIFYHYRRNNEKSTMANINKKKTFDVFPMVKYIEKVLVDNGAYDEFKVEFSRFKINQFKEKFSELTEVFKEEYYHKLRIEFKKNPIEEVLLKNIPSNLVEFYNRILKYESYYDFCICPKNEIELPDRNDFSFNNDLFIINSGKMFKLGDLTILNYVQNDLFNNNFTNLKAHEALLNEDLFNYNYYSNNQVDSNIDLLLYYIYKGYKNNDNPTPFFDSKHYGSLYGLSDKNINPYVYYIQNGRFEGKNRLNKTIGITSVNQRELNRKIRKFNHMGIDNNEKTENLIISLTSFPERMVDIKFTLFSLFNQTLKPNKIILNLTYDEFPNQENNVPNEVLKFKKYGLTINWCENLRSYTKLIPTLEEHPNDIIVTADDDIFYRRNWLEILWNEHENYPKDIILHRPRIIKFKSKNKLDYYNNWPLHNGALDSSYLNFITGVGGALYPPNSLDKEVFNRKIFQKLVPTGDDIWFWAMAVKNHTKMKVPADNMPFLIYNNALRELNLSKDRTLWSNNQVGSNDVQINALIRHYPEIMQILSGETDV